MVVNCNQPSTPGKEPTMLPVDAHLLRAVAPDLTTRKARRHQADVIDALGAVLQETLRSYDITTRLRIAHFVAQACRQSDGFTDSGGLLWGGVPGCDPQPAVALATACQFWQTRDVNADADNDDLIGVTRTVSGGRSALTSRRRYLNKAKTELARTERLTRANEASDGRPVLARGSHGADVTRLQTLLRGIGYPVTIDERFGGSTELAVLTAQRDNGLPADGIVDAPTWDALEQRSVTIEPPTAAVAPSLKRYWPLEAGRIVTSEYGPRPDGFHYGMDFGWPGGSANKPVYAVQAGTVIYSGAAQGYGGPDPAGWLVIDSTDEEGGGALEYGHIVREVNYGDHVTAGQRIAHINPQRKTNGGVPPHLHVSAWQYAYGQGGKVNPRSRWLRNPSEPGPDLTAFPLPAGYFYGPLDGPDNSVSGEYPGEPAAWRDGLGRWQATLGLPVTKKWNDGATPRAATTLQRSLGLPPTPGIGYGCIGKAEWDAVMKNGWRLPKS
jgi:murein DD-endopeptidase MepM/ murein hydrolase activator NlpD